MARPRVFISSTFYDLRQIRADLDSFIQRMGYDPVRNESGKITYGKEQKLEEYCYREIASCDIVVAVIGGRFGSQSQQSAYSVSQSEIRTAVKQEKTLFIFIEKGVHTEYQTYLKNKDIEDTRYHYVDHTKIYAFIEEVLNLPKNNSVHPFETADDITEFLKEQWAGMFQRFLQEQDRAQETSLILRLDQTAATLDRLVQYLSEKDMTQSEALEQIVISNHPAFRRLAKVVGIPFRTFFETREELNKLLVALEFKKESITSFESLGGPAASLWTREEEPKGTISFVKVRDELFDKDGRIQPLGAIRWNDDWISKETRDWLDELSPAPEVSDDDLPF